MLAVDDGTVVGESMLELLPLPLALLLLLLLLLESASLAVNGPLGGAEVSVMSGVVGAVTERAMSDLCITGVPRNPFPSDPGEELKHVGVSIV